jgi:hypothetical protein
MVRIPAALAGCLVIASAAAQVQPSPDDLLLRIRRKQAAELARLPNYTCTETIERTVRQPSKHNFEPVDTLRIEIAYVGGTELVAWPGADRFEKQIGDLVTRKGAIGNGNFALHAHNVFLTDKPVFSGPTEESLDGRKAVRYDFRISKERSRLRIGNYTHRAVVPYHGSFWVDADSLDLLRLETLADEIPRELGLSESNEVMDYERLRIGDSDFVLPTGSELIMTDLDGTRHRNRVRIAACRQYLGESIVRFGEAEASPETLPAKPEVVRLPAGLKVEVDLTTGVDVATAAIGDPIAARVHSDVKKGGVVLIPRGATLSGRLTRIDKRGDAIGPYYVIGLRFSSLKFGNTKSAFTGRLEDVGFGTMKYYIESGSDTSPEESLLFARPAQVVLPVGVRMAWRTLEPRP